MSRVLLLGVSGMLGAAVARVLAAEPTVELVAADRERFDARTGDPRVLLEEVEPDWVVNAIGVTKPHIDPASADSVAAALDVNARFPFALAEAARLHGARVIQIATDGVFSGESGGYREDAPHDALDVYGKSKSLGEVPAANVVNLRCSIIGAGSLVGWLLEQPSGATRARLRRPRLERRDDLALRPPLRGGRERASRPAVAPARGSGRHGDQGGAAGADRARVRPRRPHDRVAGVAPPPSIARWPPCTRRPTPRCGAPPATTTHPRSRRWWTSSAGG